MPDSWESFGTHYKINDKFILYYDIVIEKWRLYRRIFLGLSQEAYREMGLGDIGVSYEKALIGTYSSEDAAKLAAKSIS